MAVTIGGRYRLELTRRSRWRIHSKVCPSLKELSALMPKGRIVLGSPSLASDVATPSVSHCSAEECSSYHWYSQYSVPVAYSISSAAWEASLWVAMDPPL